MNKEKVTRDDGGPAFPQQEFQKVGDIEMGKSTFGMSLRDYFAAAALQALANNRIIQDSFMNPDSENDELGEKLIAESSYRIADAMLKEREK